MLVGLLFLAVSVVFVLGVFAVHFGRRRCGSSGRLLAGYVLAGTTARRGVFGVVQGLITMISPVVGS